VALRVHGRVTTSDSDRADTRADDAARLAGSLLAAAGCMATDLTGIGVTIGPGSYTGVRIGLALVRGLSLVDGLPVVGLGTLDLLAEAAPASADRVCSVLDAGGGKLYAAVFERGEERWTSLVAPRVLEQSELAAFVQTEAVGAVVVHSEDETKDGCGVASLAVAGPSRMAVLANIAARRLQLGEGVRADRVLPMYVGATGARPNRERVVTAGFADE